MHGQQEIETEKSVPPKSRIPGLFWLGLLALLSTTVALGLTVWVPRLLQQRAIAEIERHGGSVYSQPYPGAEFMQFLGGVERQVLAIDLSKVELQDYDLYLLTNFKDIRYLSLSGPELSDVTVEQLKEFTKLENLVLVNWRGMSESALQILKTELPSLRISRRGPALLGIMGKASRFGCRVMDVRAGTSAAKAGLLPGDVIVSFDGERVNDFQVLTQMIGRQKPGDVVPVVLYRRGNRIELTVKLGAWKEPTHR